MKILNKISLIVTAMLLSVSCNKPYNNYDDYIDNPEDYNVVYTALAANNPYKLEVDLAAKKDTVINISANFGGLGYPKQDVMVNFAAKPELVENYNNENLTEYEILHKEAYSMSTDPVVISKGKLISSPLKITLKSSELKGTGPYLLPVKIETVSADIKIKESLSTLYLLVEGTYRSYVYMSQAEKVPYEFDLDMAKETEFDVIANYKGTAPLTQDVTVDFSIKPELVDKYNSKYNTSYEVLSEEAYSISTDPAVIAKGGEVSSPFKITLTPSKIEKLGSYLLPINLDAVSSDIKIKDDQRTLYLLINCTYTFFDRSNWSVVDYSTQEDSGVENDPDTGKKRGWVYCVYDGDIQTYWHSRWVGGEAPLPHWFVLDMHEKSEVHGFKITGRTIGGESTWPMAYGNATHLKVYTGNDGTTWENSQEFVCDNPLEQLTHLFYFSHIIEARYIKVEILDVTRPSWNANGIAGAISELEVF